MTLDEVIARLYEHFSFLRDDRPLTHEEYYLEDAVLTMFSILDYAKLLIDKFGSLEAAMDALECRDA